MTIEYESKKCTNKFRLLLHSRVLTQAFTAAFLSGILGVVLRIMDVDMKYDFLKTWNPDPVVFNVFVVFASLVAAFRTSHALVRYTDAAALMHKLTACWYDTTSTLVAFLRTSEASPKEIQHFQETIIRLISLLNALCLDGLEQKESDFESGHCFEVIGWHDLTEDLQDGVMISACRVEFVFQCVQQLVVDAMKREVITIAPPILTRSFQELGAGMLIYHEAKKLSCVPLPFAYQFITRVILVCEALFVPFIMATVTAGALSTFTYTFGGTVMLWFLNGVAESLDNPFRKEADSLETDQTQIKLNIQLRELVRNSSSGTPGLRPEWQHHTAKKGRVSATGDSIQGLKKSYSTTRMMSVRLSKPGASRPLELSSEVHRSGNALQKAEAAIEACLDDANRSPEAKAPPERTQMGTPPRSPREGDGEPPREPPWPQVGNPPPKVAHISEGDCEGSAATPIFASEGSAGRARQSPGERHAAAIKRGSGIRDQESSTSCAGPGQPKSESADQDARPNGQACGKPSEDHAKPIEGHVRRQNVEAV